jgi:hypothetical protein
MKGIFKFTPKEGYNLRDILFDLIHNQDFIRYLKANVGNPLIAMFSPAKNQSEKEQMYAYYHKVVLGVAMQAFTDDGWEGVDKVKADHLLKSMFAKDIMYNHKTGKEEVYLEDKSAMNKGRLIKFITDCIIWLEIERGVAVPDADEYKAYKQTGISGFKSIKNNNTDF